MVALSTWPHTQRSERKPGTSFPLSWRKSLVDLKIQDTQDMEKQNVCSTQKKKTKQGYKVGMAVPPLTQGWEAIPPSQEWQEELYWPQTLTHVCVLSRSVVSDSVTPWTAAHQAPLAMGILQARILEWVAMPSSVGSFQPRDRTQVSGTAGRFFTDWATREVLWNDTLLF